MESTPPTNEELLKAYQMQQQKRKYNAAYMKRFRIENREKWNKQQREMYAQRKAREAHVDMEDYVGSMSTDTTSS